MADTDRMVVTQYRGTADKLRDSELEARAHKWGYGELKWETLPNTSGGADLRRLTALPKDAIKRRAVAAAKAKIKAAASSSSAASG